MPAGDVAATGSQISFYFLRGPNAGLIYLEMVGNCSCRPQSTVHTKQFKFFSNIMTSLHVGSTSSTTSGTLYGFHGVTQGLWHYHINTMKNT